jgi:hypothetical protein
MASQTLTEPTGLLVRRFVALAWEEGCGQEEKEGVREVVRALWICVVVSGACLVAVLRLFGWKCCF